MIISFAWTTPALLAGAKTVTRRDWSVDYARRFTVGMLVDAWDHSPRTRKGRKVATIRITRAPYIERSDVLSNEHYSREGFVWLREHGDRETVARIMRTWGDNWRYLYVIEFELVEVLGVSSPSPARVPPRGERGSIFSSSRGDRG